MIKIKVLAIISFVLGLINVGIVLLFVVIGGFLCYKPFYIIHGSEGAISTCVPLHNTSFIWFLLAGIVLLIIGIVFVILYIKRTKKVQYKMFL